MGPLGELGALFNPGMRHELEERRAKQMLREEEGNARKGDLRIDLESGVAVISTDRDRAAGERADRSDDADDRGDENGADPRGDGDPGGPASPEPADDEAAVADERPASGRPRPVAAPRQPARPGTPVPSGKARRGAGGSSPARSG